MKDIEVIGNWGDRRKKIKLSWPFGAGQVIHILVDNYLHGEFVKRSGEWVLFLNPKSDLCSNDILVMREAIEQ